MGRRRGGVKVKIRGRKVGDKWGFWFMEIVRCGSKGPSSECRGRWEGDVGGADVGIGGWVNWMGQGTVRVGGGRMGRGH